MVATKPGNGDVFNAIATPMRRQILDLLRTRERAVHELNEHFDVTQPALSQHLRILRGAGLVTHERRGREHVYRIRPHRLRDVSRWIEHYEQFWTGRLETLGAELDKRQCRRRS